ncbi:MAG: NAD(P)H-binding protein [SAR324 cluster bacterium]|nr:NAD(P)H-binding protein [SAR324 cluster bacterium]
MDNERPIKRVFLTGATGFVGREVLEELVVRGYHPICLVRSAHRAEPLVAPFADRPRVVVGTLFDQGALRTAMADADAVIHLVGIIFEHRFSGQTFERIHRTGTANVARAAQELGIARFIHMSALGSRPDAVSRYHRTKYQAEQLVQGAGFDWTIFRPSLIHGPDGEFMQLMARFVRKMIPPVIPYFGSGEARLQPVSVKDVAACMVAALSRPETIGQIYSVGGPEVYTWKTFYATCQRLIPGARRWKPMVSIPPYTIFGFELMVLLGGIFTAIGMLVLGYFDLMRKRLPGSQKFKTYGRFSDDRFGVVVRCAEGEAAAVEKVMKAYNVEECVSEF